MFSRYQGASEGFIFQQLWGRHRAIAVEQCFPDLCMYSHRQGILLECRFRFGRCKEGLESLHI